MFCNSCGVKVPEGSKFCHNCGSRLGASETQSTNTSAYPNVGAAAPVKKKRFGVIIAAALILLVAVIALMTPCIFGHTWLDADCTNASRCADCGKISGEALGHDWSEASCIDLSTCTRCGETTGDYADHIWEDANCTMASVCSVCGKEKGDPLGHSWNEPKANETKKCLRCGHMAPLTRPTNGEVLIGKGSRLESTIQVVNESDEDCFFILKNESFETLYGFYIHAGTSKHVAVPSGQLYVYLSRGTDWYGVEKYFGEGTEPVRDSDLLDFDEYWWIYTIE